MMRIGIIKYINSLPLHRGLERYGELVFDTPRRLADQFKKKKLDVAFIPSVEYIVNKENYVLVEGVSISSFGYTNSVYLIYTGEMSALKTIQLSPDSMSANEVTRHILACVYNAYPDFSDKQNEAAVGCGRIVIGDCALSIEDSVRPDEKYLDIGMAWYDLTQLPMVYAVCVSVNAHWAAVFSEHINQVKRENFRNLEALLVPEDRMRYYPYLRGLNYDLTKEHRRSLQVLEQLMRTGECACVAKY